MGREMSSKRMRVVQTLSISMALLMVLLLAPSARAHDELGWVEAASEGCYDKEKSQKLKIIAVFTIPVASVIGIGLPLFSTAIPFLQPGQIPALVVKIFASGVILSKAFMHVLPNSLNDLNSEGLPKETWRIFPIITMITCVFTMMMETVATAYFTKKMDNMESPAPKNGDIGMEDQSRNSNKDNQDVATSQEQKSQLLKYRIVAQVLELGILVHSVMIGLSMGMSNNPCILIPLVADMCFHQLFEGMVLGGCILQAEYGTRVKAIMVTFFATTTPFGIALGLAILNVYNENSPGTQVVVGVLNATTSGLLIYMSLVDLLAFDFAGEKLQGSIKLQFICYFAAFLGMGIMSLMEKWAEGMT